MDAQEMVEKRGAARWGRRARVTVRRGGRGDGCGGGEGDGWKGRRRSKRAEEEEERRRSKRAEACMAATPGIAGEGSEIFGRRGLGLCLGLGLGSGSASGWARLCSNFAFLKASIFCEDAFVVLNINVPPGYAIISESIS